MKKIGVVTYCEYGSYGSILQTIGLKNTLLELGNESFVIIDRPAPAANRKRTTLFTKNPKQLFKNIYQRFIWKKLQKKYVNTLEFIKTNVDVLYYNDSSTLAKNCPKADYYIAGSDQIWHPVKCSSTFFLDFLPNDIKKISYAASMGVTEIPEKNKGRFFEYIKKFDAISVREKDMLPILQAHTDKTVAVYIDPVFLRAKEEWRTYSKTYPIKKPYILLYTIYWDKKLNNKLKKLRKESKIDIVAVCDSFSYVYANHRIYDADPAQFLWLVDNAEAVVTSSFHGVAFSLIFNKKLAAIINPKAPSRIESLLDTLGYSNNSIVDVLKESDLEYAVVNERIAEEKNKSLKYLTKELTDE